MKSALIFFFTIILLSCTNSDEKIQQSAKEETTITETKLDTTDFKEITNTGRCITNILNIRESPNLNSEKVGLLKENNIVEIVQKTRWEETIDGINNYWILIIDENGLEGWVFMGYMELENCNLNDIPFSYIKRENQTVFYNIEELDPDHFSNDNFLTFGIEDPLDIPQNKEIKLHFDRLYDFLYILNSPIPEFAIKIIAKDPNNKSYEFNYSIYDRNMEVLTTDENDPHVIFDNPVISLDFSRFASFPNGKWEMMIYYDNKPELIISEFIEMDSSLLTISDIENPQPDMNKTTNKFQLSQDDVIHYWINTDEYQEGFLVLYYYTNENEQSYSPILKPVKAVHVILNNNHIYHGIVKLGNDLEPGQYFWGFGQETIYTQYFNGRFEYTYEDGLRY